MNKLFTPGTRFLMDPIGMMYAATVSKEEPGNYTVSAKLNEKIKPEILQQAVNDLFKRLPLLNGKLVETADNFYHELLATPPTITVDKGLTPYEQYYQQGEGHVVRVVYGERHFKVEAIHTITDGRSVTEVVKAILIRYFELQGIEVESGYGLDFDQEMTAEESENAFERFADSNATSEAEETPIELYQHEGSRSAVQHITTLDFDLSKIKAAAKSFGVSINTYVTAHLMAAVAKERAQRESEKPIIFSYAADQRTFFPSKTFRNFATGGML